MCCCGSKSGNEKEIADCLLTSRKYKEWWKIDTLLKVIFTLGKWALGMFLCMQILNVLISYAGGVGFSILCISALIFVFWFPTQDRIGVDSEDSEKRDESNPLYLKKMFRKRTNGKIDSLFTADLKGDYVCQVHAGIQIMAFTIYGIYSAFHGWRHFRNVEIVFLIWLTIGIFTHSLVKIYYEVNFDMAYRRTPWSPWRPFSFTGNRRNMPRSYETVFTEFDDLKNSIFLFCKTKGYQLVYKEKWSNSEKAWIFIKNHKRSVEILELIRIPVLEKKHIKLLDDSFEIFAKERLHKKNKLHPIYFTFLLCVDEETRPYRKIMNTDVIPGIRRHRLPAGITFEDRTIYIPGWDVGYGDRTYKKMRKNFCDMLELED